MKIAIVRLSSLGDIIHSLICVQFIRQKLPNSEIHWICDSSFKSLLECNDDIDKIHDFPIRKTKGILNKIKLLNEIKKLREEKFDYVIDMQGLLKSAIISSIISKNIHGFSWNSSKEKIASFFYKNKYKIPYKKNIFFRNLDLIEKTFNFNISKIEFLNFKKYLNKKDNRSLIDFDKKNKNIILIPASSSSEKNIPIETYANIINYSKKYKFHIIYGSDIEYKKCINIKEKAPSLNILPKMNLKELVSVISKSDLVIGSDTGPTHMAFAQKIPSITIYWKKAKSSYKRNSLQTKSNKILVFENLNKINISKILDNIHKLI